MTSLDLPLSQLPTSVASENRILIVIVNYKTPDITLNCLNSIAKVVDEVQFDVVVIDNGSNDFSGDAIAHAIKKNGWSSWCEVKLLGNNLGFAGGNNFAIRQNFSQTTITGGRSADFVLLLNSDTLLHSGCLSYCVRKMASNPRIGALSCRLLNTDASLQIVARRFLSPMRLIVGATGLPWRLPRIFGWAQLEYYRWNMETQAGDVDWIGGAYMLLRRSALEQVGLLDEDFFFYGEDIEFCFRLRAHNWIVHYDPAVTTVHLGGASSDASRMMTTERNRAQWNARYQFLRKCYGSASMWMVWAIDLVAVAIRLCYAYPRSGANSPIVSKLLMDLRSIVNGQGSA